ncbi:FAD-dependent monooxygenase [Roseivirga pacifica]|uniref:FAD-dependent monooxygenase n=1 Tax=Roseivirga pacifica TaxID=1267423 RepID=UPI003BAF7E19
MNQISIIGGGIGGLVTALCFDKLKIPYKLYERARSLEAVGAGIWLSPNALQVLEWIDPNLLRDIQQSGNSFERILLTNHKLVPISSSNQRFVYNKFGYTTLAIHRGQLQKRLYNHSNQSNIILGKEFRGYNTLNDHTYEIEFTDSTSTTTHSIIAADGINSKVRKQLFPESQIRYSGQTCWRGISNFELPNNLSSTGFTLWGKKLQFGVSKVEEGKVYWFAVRQSEPNLQDEKEGLKDKLIQMFVDYDPLVRQLISNTPSEKIIRGDLSELKPLKKWNNGNICLLGDAAHSMTPDLGQGGAQAIEDAYYLSNFISNYPQHLSIAFNKFCTYRQPKVNALAKQSRTISKIAIVSKPIELLRNTILKYSPQKAIEKRMIDLYSIAKDSPKV